MEIKISENILSFTPAFDNPFIFGYSKLNIKMQADKLDDKTHFVINRVKIYDKLSGSKKILLAEKDLNQPLYTINSRIDEDFIFEIERNNTNGERVIKDNIDLFIEVFYDKKYVDTNGNPREFTSSFERDILEDLPIIIMPNSVCDESVCKDNNSCTRDYCKALNGYKYCINEYRLDVSCCGNKQCDSGEDKCSCPFDCGECDFDYGDFIHYTCNDNEKCVPKIKDNTLEEKSKIYSTTSISDFKFDVKISYDQPFDLDSTFKIEMTLQNLNSNVNNPEIQSIQLVESSDNLLGELSLNEGFADIGKTRTYNLEPDSLSMTEPERSLNPTIIVKFKYTTVSTDKETVNLKKESFKLDKISFVDT